MEVLNKITVVMDSRRNYHHYRDLIKTASPVVPYLGTQSSLWNECYHVACIYKVYITALYVCIVVYVLSKKHRLCTTTVVHDI